MRRHRILVVAHNHPDFSPGGGELAAYNLYKAYRENDMVEDAWFLARADRGAGATGAIRLRRPNEYLWEQAVHDWHMMKAVNQESLTTWFSDLIRALRPTVVHTHHYAHLGLEYLRVVKLVDPEIRIFMTLHEYMAICRNNGQMIKANGHALCSRESFDECHRCFPEKTPEDFWLRKHYFQRQFDLIDRFFAPSEFLRQRYIEWGLSPERIVVCENGQAKDEPLPPRPLAAGETRNRFGFFGQITPYKGLDVVLEALNQMADTELILEVHGANLEVAAQDFREKIEGLSAPLIKDKAIQWMGPYQASELRGRMAGVDWVLVPSIWWENSPLVIQEAYKYGRPVICSDIGGMAEKVRDGITGLHFHARNPGALAAIMKKCVRESLLWETLRENLPVPMTIEESVNTHTQTFSKYQREHEDHGRA